MTNVYVEGMKRLLYTGVVAVILVALLASCGTYQNYRSINRSITNLQLGMSRSQVMSRVNAEPSFVKGETKDGVVYEELHFQSYVTKGNRVDRYKPIIYVLSFRDHRLVAIDTKRDTERLVIDGAGRVIDIWERSSREH